MRFAAGLHERLITLELEKQLQAAECQFNIIRASVDPAEAPDVFSQYMQQLIARRLKDLPAGDSAEETLAGQLRICNALVDQLEGTDSQDHLTPAILLAVQDLAHNLATQSAPIRPGIPLTNSALLSNARGEYRIGTELKKEIALADRIDLLCSFLMWSGVRVLEGALEEFLNRPGKQMRILTTTYMDATQLRALEALESLGAKIRISYEQRTTRLHAKAWRFVRRSGYSTAYVGSSNLSHTALIDGLEWNVRLSAIENKAVLHKMEGLFETYWNDPEFAPFDRVKFLENQKRQADKTNAQITFFDVVPYPYQAEILETLQLRRTVYRENRSLVVAATGTGKTIISALDYKQLRAEHGALKLLFVAHRERILEQSRSTFRQVLRDANFGEILAGGRRPDDGKHVFATIQSLSQIDLEVELDPTFFEVVIVDEVHHEAAQTYRRLLNHVQPKFLVGLTATPERADGQSILKHFGGKITTELRLWEAIDRGLLVPFQYFVVHDGTDLRHLTFRTGAYQSSELEDIYTASDAVVNHVLNELERLLDDHRSMRALGFCSGIRHAEFMTVRFNTAGVPAGMITGETRDADRMAAIRKLRDGKLNILFTVDVFNEGIDIPEVDTVLFLRPTQSPTLFLQQLGRGLRHSKSTRKTCLTVLDFVGQCHRDFRFDPTLCALTRSNRGKLARDIEEGFPLLPSGCTLELDRQSQEIILENLRQTLNFNRPRLRQELTQLGRATRLPEFLDHLGMDLEEFYRRDRTFSRLRQEVGFLNAPEEELKLGDRLSFLCHLDDPKRIDTFAGFVKEELAIGAAPRLFNMFMAILAPSQVRPAFVRVFSEMLKSPWLCQELLDLLNICRETRIYHIPIAWGNDHDIPLKIHATYSRDEIMAAFDRFSTQGKLSQPLEGVFHARAEKTVLMWVTINKSEKEYSATTMYEDYAISPELFHWQSQHSTREDSEVGQRFIHHREQGYQMLLFVRVSRKDARGQAIPYEFWGPAYYVTHQGERPMSITWKLKFPAPADSFQQARLVSS